jgi:hypothetical protein
MVIQFIIGYSNNLRHSGPLIFCNETIQNIAGKEPPKPAVLARNFGPIRRVHPYSFSRQSRQHCGRLDASVMQKGSNS